MTTWYFLFEGRFRAGDPTYGCNGVCSSSMVPADERQTAYELFLEALDKVGINLIKIENDFKVDPDELDQECSDNDQWIEWHNDSIRSGEVLFDPWQVFDPDSEE